MEKEGGVWREKKGHGWERGDEEGRVMIKVYKLG